jgi:2-amino-4-hydroxy-6-hydroxymethyldihydropteridine diphosphokinase
MTTDVVILGGGNVGDVVARLDSAEMLISERIGAVVARSDWHTTEPWGFESERSFTNRAYVVRTEMAATEVLEILLDIEAELGRNRTEEYRHKVLCRQSYANRAIDLDILLYGNEVVVTPHLQVPHPHLLERDFALVPMCQALGIEIAEGRELVIKIVKNEI